MNPAWMRAFSDFQRVAQIASVTLIAGLALGLAGSVLLAAVGYLPWLSLPLASGGDPGPMLQMAGAALLVALSSFLPSSLRVMRLEAAHREFRLKMEDVGRAYWAAHAADREGTFTLRREFDAVRERFDFLRAHPDLGALDPEILDLAAQMSHESRELARIYADEKVTRAREMLALRQQEAAEMEERIATANAAITEMRHALQGVEIDEDVVRARLDRLREDLAELLPEIERPGPGPRKPKLGVVAGE